MRKFLPVLVLLVVAAAVAAWYWKPWVSSDLPPGIVSANGRTEAERIDIAAKYSGRLEEVLVREGDLVEAGTVVATLDAAEVKARLREAEAVVRQSEEGLNEANALLAQRESERVFAERELHRAEQLASRGYTPAETVDLRRAEHATSVAAVASAQAGIARARASIEAARATVERISADLDEHRLVAPRGGRVQYRLAEPGEVVAAGGKIISMLDLNTVYMTVYLPTDAAGRLRYGAEARLVFDAAPQYVVPASITFVASEAQFTPRYVETASEREKLMFRVKVSIPPEVLERYREIVKTGVPGVAYIPIAPDIEWPETLAVRLPDAD